MEDEPRRSLQPEHLRVQLHCLDDILAVFTLPSHEQGNLFPRLRSVNLEKRETIGVNAHVAEFPQIHIEPERTPEPWRLPLAYIENKRSRDRSDGAQVHDVCLPLQVELQPRLLERVGNLQLEACLALDRHQLQRLECRVKRGFPADNQFETEGISIDIKDVDRFLVFITRFILPATFDDADINFARLKLIAEWITPRLAIYVGAFRVRLHIAHRARNGNLFARCIECEDFNLWIVIDDGIFVDTHAERIREGDLEVSHILIDITGTDIRVRLG